MPQISTKASNAASASFLVSAIQISCSARLAFGCWLFGSLLSTLAVLCTQQRWPRVLGHTSSTACQKPSAPSATASSGPMASPRRLRSSRRWKDRRRKADALRTFANPSPHARTAHRDRPDAGHNLALGQMPVAHQTLAPILGPLVGMAVEQGRDLGLDGLRQQRSRAIAQHLSQRISKSSWLGELENVSLGHGVSLLRWRSGGFKHPHDTPPYPLMPSPTFAHSSSLPLDLDDEASHRQDRVRIQ